MTVTPIAALQGRVALITGAGRGIGREIAIGLAAAGASVALVARTPEQLDEAARDHRHGWHRARDRGRRRRPRAASAAVQEAVASLGRIDVLVNNAAMVAPLGPTQSLDPAEIETALRVNVTAPIALTGLVLPGMLASGWGRDRQRLERDRAEPRENGRRHRVCGFEGGAGGAHAQLGGGARWHGRDRQHLPPRGSGHGDASLDPRAATFHRRSALHDRFAEMHASGTLLSPQHSAARPLEKLIGSDRSGQVWSAGD